MQLFGRRSKNKSCVTQRRVATRSTIFTTTASHSSEKDGLAEGPLRMLFNAVRTALEHSQLPKRYFSYAAKVAVGKAKYLPTRHPIGTCIPPSYICFRQGPQPTIFLPVGQPGLIVPITDKRPKLAPDVHAARYFRGLTSSRYLVLLPSDQLRPRRGVPHAPKRPLTHLRIRIRPRRPTNVQANGNAAVRTPRHTKFITRGGPTHELRNSKRRTGRTGEHNIYNRSNRKARARRGSTTLPTPIAIAHGAL